MTNKKIIFCPVLLIGLMLIPVSNFANVQFIKIYFIFIRAFRK